MKLLCKIGIHRWEPENTKPVIDVYGISHERGSQGVPRYRDCGRCDKRELHIYGKWQ